MMTLVTGSRKINSDQRGLTLFEVLVCALILSVSLIVIYRPLLTSIGVLVDSENRAQANLILADQIWSFQDEFRRMKKIPKPLKDQIVTSKDKAFYLSLSHRPISADKKLYEAAAEIQWKNGVRSKRLVRIFYAASF